MSYYQPQQFLLCDMIPVLSWCDGFISNTGGIMVCFLNGQNPRAERVLALLHSFENSLCELLSIFKFLAFHFITKKNKLKQNKNKILSVQDSRPDVESLCFLCFFLPDMYSI